MKIKVFSNKIWSIPLKPRQTKKSASLLELFFDLVLVAFIGGIVHVTTDMFKNERNNFVLFEFLFLMSTLLSFILIWWSVTSYNSRYERVDVRHRLYILIIMIGLIIITTSTYLGFKKDMSNFNDILKVQAIGYGFTLIPLFILNISPLFKQKDKYESKLLIFRSSGVLFASFMWALLFLINIYVYPNELEIQKIITIIFWIIGFVGWLLFDMLSRTERILINVFENSLTHIQERFGIIFIAFIGEAVIQIIVKSAEPLINNIFSTIGLIIASFILVYAMWWWFNDITNYPELINHPKRLNLFYALKMISLFSMVIITIGVSLTIQYPMFIAGKIFLSFGFFLWLLTNGLMFIFSKDYKKMHDIYFSKKVRLFVILAPFISIPFILIGMFEPIKSYIFLLICLGYSITIISIITIAMKKQQSYAIENKYKIERIIHEFEEKEIKWIKKEVDKYGDYEHHKSYDFELNHYSKYIKDYKK